MSESMTCPYCETKVKMSEVDAEDGSCPECGAPLLGSTLWLQQDAGFDEEEDERFFNDEEGDDSFQEDDEDNFFADDEDDI